MNIKELGYVVLAATDLDAWHKHASQVLGAMASDLPGVGLRLRIDERDCRLLVRQSTEDRMLAMGWLLADEDAWHAALDEVRASGFSSVLGSQEECVERRITAFFALTDPAGHRHEIGWGPVVNFRQPFLSPIGITAFLTGDQGMGHLVVGCEPDQYEPTREFIRKVLGFKVANFRQQSLDIEPIKIPITWFHCDNTRQHSLGLAPTFTPGVARHGCRHINLEVTQIDDVGQAYDRAEQLGTPIARTLGRHVNDRAFSFYMASPSGFLFEYGCDAPRRNWGQEIVYDEGGTGSLWGHKWVLKQ